MKNLNDFKKFVIDKNLGDDTIIHANVEGVEYVIDSYGYDSQNRQLLLFCSDNWEEAIGKKELLRLRYKIDVIEMLVVCEELKTIRTVTSFSIRRPDPSFGGLNEVIFQTK